MFTNRLFEYCTPYMELNMDFPFHFGAKIRYWDTAKWFKGFLEGDFAAVRIIEVCQTIYQGQNTQSVLIS